MLCLIVLAGCAGAQFRLPELTDAEIDRAALAVVTDTHGLESNGRGDAENEKLVMTAANRLRRVAPALCAHAGAESCFFDVAFVDDDLVNAQASDGQRIEIFRGLLDFLDTEDEIAAVIGHEMGHHIAAHLEEARQNASVGAVIAGLLMGGALAASGYQSSYYYDPYEAQRVIYNSMQMGAAIGVIAFSKEQEREADLISAYLLQRAGYDLHAAGQVWTVLARMDTDTRASWLDTHPAGPERIAAWEKAIIEVEHSPDLLPDE